VEGAGYFRTDARLSHAAVLWTSPVARAAMPGKRNSDVTGELAEAPWTAAFRRQSRSNQVSGRSLPKTGIFATSGGDFRRSGRQKTPTGKEETGGECAKAPVCGLF